MSSGATSHCAPVLVVGYGNPGRGDDAAGPALVRRLRSTAGEHAAAFETLTAVQLMIEHAEVMNGRSLVVFVDASESAPPPYRLSRLNPGQDRSYTSHALSPRALLEVQRRAFGQCPPSCWLLEVPGKDFALGQPISATTTRYIDAALEALRQLIAGALPTA